MHENLDKKNRCNYMISKFWILSFRNNRGKKTICNIKTKDISDQWIKLQYINYKLILFRKVDK